jgi:hypothetical protein
MQVVGCPCDAVAVEPGIAWWAGRRRETTPRVDGCGFDVAAGAIDQMLFPKRRRAAVALASVAEHTRGPQKWSRKDDRLKNAGVRSANSSLQDPTGCHAGNTRNHQQRHADADGKREQISGATRMHEEGNYERHGRSGCNADTAHEGID